MANRTRKNKLTLYLSDDEKYILENKTRLSGLNSQSAYLRNLIIYGYVYEVDYRYLHDYSVELSRIGGLLNQITKRANTTGILFRTGPYKDERYFQRISIQVSVILKVSAPTSNTHLLPLVFYYTKGRFV